MDHDSDNSSSDSSDCEVRAPKQKKHKKTDKKGDTFVEIYNVQKLIWLLHHWNELGLKEDVREYRKMVSQLSCSKETWPYGQQSINYERNVLGFGRLVPTSLCYILMNKRIRQTVADGMYADIDFVNCHMFIYIFLCKKFEVPTRKWEFIQYYIQHRDTVIEEALEGNLELGCTADDIKKWFLSVMNGMQVEIDFSRWVLTPYMSTFLESMPFVHDLLTAEVEREPRYLNLRQYILQRDGPNATNLNCKVISLVLMDYEDRMRDCLAQYVSSKGFDWSVNCYDGGMSYLKRNREDIFSGLNLDLAQKHIMDKLGIECILKFKSMYEKIIATPQLESIVFDHFTECTYMEGMSYEAVKWRFEKNNFFCRRDVQYYTENNNTIQVYSDNEFQNKYKDLKFLKRSKSGKQKSVGFMPVWMRDTDKRKYEIVGFFPPGFNEIETNPDDPNDPTWFYSTWKGFAAEKIVPDGNDHSEGVLTLRNHILYLCNENTSYQLFIEKYVKHMLCFPGRKTDMVLAFKAVQGGEGKNTFFEMIKNMIGSQYCITSGNHERDWFGDFNETIHNKLWVHMEEMSKDVLRKHQKQFLAYVTSKTDTINLKGGKKLKGVPSFCNYFITFNSQGVEYFPGLKRRLWIHELTNPLQGTQYYNKLYQAMNDPQIIRAYYDYLMSTVDISNFKPSDEKDCPMTPYMSKLWGKEDSPKDRFDTFIEGSILEWFLNKMHPNVYRISVGEYFEMYSAKLKAEGVSATYIGVVQNFNKRLEIVFPDSCGVINRTKSKGKNYLVIDIDAAMTFLVNERKWFKWEDLGWEEQYDTLVYKVVIPCRKQCIFKNNRAHLTYQMCEEGRAINYFNHRGIDSIEHDCQCGGKYYMCKK